MSTDSPASKLELRFVVSISLIGATFFRLHDSDSSQMLGNADVTEPQILRAIQDGDDLQVLVHADEAKLPAGEDRLRRRRVRRRHDGVDRR